jgi:hypothetical protein
MRDFLQGLQTPTHQGNTPTICQESQGCSFAYTGTSASHDGYFGVGHTQISFMFF